MIFLYKKDIFCVYWMLSIAHDSFKSNDLQLSRSLSHQINQAFLAGFKETPLKSYHSYYLDFFEFWLSS